MIEAIDTICSTREGVRNAMKLGYENAQAIVADGKRVRIRIEQSRDVRSLRQNAFLWGHVYAEISLQGVVCGQRWIDLAWHEYFKRLFLGWRFEEVVPVPGQVITDKRARVRRVLRSTTELSVKEMSEYLEKVLAWGVTELGVTFETMDWSAWEQHGGRA